MRSFNGAASAIVFLALGALASTGCVGQTGDDTVGEAQAADQGQQAAPGAPWETAPLPVGQSPIPSLPGSVGQSPIPAPPVLPGSVIQSPIPTTQAPGPVAQAPAPPSPQGTCNCQTSTPPQTEPAQTVPAQTVPAQTETPPPQTGGVPPVGGVPIGGVPIGVPIPIGGCACPCGVDYFSPLMGFFNGLPLCWRI